MFGAPLSQVSDFLERADNIEPDKDNVLWHSIVLPNRT